MTDYNAILDTETDPSAPLKSSLFKRMVANPIAITEAAVGAPRIVQGAFAPLTAGTTYAATINASDTSTGTTAFKDVGTARLLNSGVVRISGSHQTSGGGVASELRFMVNGVQQASWSTTSTSPVARSADLTVAINDIITVQHRTLNAGQTSTATGVTISAANGNLFALNGA
jgi:hypothetical protein